jgi:peptidoglycan/LPS O-acetylase OafA/YrhL
MKKSSGADLAKNLPGLDGLRGVACLMVFAVHFGQIAKVQGAWGAVELRRLLENGNAGVALFFALSGFLLSRPYWQSLSLGSPQPLARNFWLRRLARVVPAYFLCLTGLIVVNRLWLEDTWPRDALLHYAFAFNYFDANIFSINPPFWTVAVELQFYLVLPLIFLAFGRMRPAWVVASVATLACIAYAAHSVMAATLTRGLVPGGQLSPVVTYSLLAHLPHFLLGVVTAWWVNRSPSPSWSPVEQVVPFKEAALWLAFLLLFVVLGTPLDELFQVPHGRYNLPYVPLLLCAVIALTPQTATGWILLQNSPLRPIGRVSYGVYLYHLPVLHWVARLMERFTQSPHENWLMFGSVSLTVTLVAATLSFFYFEKPILRLVHRK